VEAANVGLGHCNKIHLEGAAIVRTIPVHSRIALTTALIYLAFLGQRRLGAILFGSSIICFVIIMIIKSVECVLKVGVVVIVFCIGVFGLRLVFIVATWPSCSFILMVFIFSYKSSAIFHDGIIVAAFVTPVMAKVAAFASRQKAPCCHIRYTKRLVRRTCGIFCHYKQGTMDPDLSPCGG
jgi:hypothetical protein